MRKKLKPTNLLLEQLDTVTAGVDQGTKFDATLEFLRAARSSEQQETTMAEREFYDVFSRMYA